jgi:hypothetical protein
MVEGVDASGVPITRVEVGAIVGGSAVALGASVGALVGGIGVAVGAGGAQLASALPLAIANEYSIERRMNSRREIIFSSRD